ncbi:unnamed protein product [marine sediment metagenome]|uniref:Uncharacterized protein n=1 Tax=marine sediment metagenome TaxID=412755 RepID=X1FPH9_9ZZZZ
MDCELCQLINGNTITKKYYSNLLITVVECKTCRVPMLVLNRHSMRPTNVELAKIITKSGEIGNEVFGEGEYIVDRDQRCIKDHLHWHIRKK